jgi:hypothetical protein
MENRCLRACKVINASVQMSGELTVVTADGKTLHLKSVDPVVELVNTPQ